MRVLVDTSIWSLALRRTEQIRSSEVPELRRLITEHLVEIIGPIRQEILSGIRKQFQFERLDSYLAAFPDVTIRCIPFDSPPEEGILTGILSMIKTACV